MAENDVNRLIDMLYERVEDAKSPALKPNLSMVDRDEVLDLLDELRADEGQTYLLVAHNGIARVVRSYFYDMTNEEYAAFGIRNCEFVEYTFA